MGGNAVSDSTNIINDSEMKHEAEAMQLHRMAKVQNFLEMGQGSKNLCATQKESCSQNNQMTAVGFISDPEDIVKASCSLFQHNGAAAFELSERSPLPPGFSAKDLPGGRTQIVNVCQIQRITRHSVGNDHDSSHQFHSESKFA